MKLPDSVKVGPYTYTVTVVPDLAMFADKNETVEGRIHFPNRTIEIRDGNALPIKTLIHEAIHAIENAYAFELKEQNVIRLANGLYEFLVSNDLLRRD